MSVYTKGGDKGETSLYKKNLGKPVRVSKNSLRINAIGGIDEVNSYLGVVVSLAKSKTLKGEIEEIQRDLFTIGSILAGSGLKLSPQRVVAFEKQIDNMEAKLPVLANFILPGGGPLGSFIHLGRTIVRRVERALVALSQKESVDPEILKYMNRLSDFLFMLARYENFKEGKKEKLWSP